MSKNEINCTKREIIPAVLDDMSIIVPVYLGNYGCYEVKMIYCLREKRNPVNPILSKNLVFDTF